MTTSTPLAGLAASVGARLPLVPAGTRATRWLLDRGYLNGRTLQVLEFPKSGGTWLAKLLATALEWPFIDDSALPPGNNCVIRAHALPTPRTPDLVYLVRDPRDVYVSLFHHRIHHWDNNPHYRQAWLAEHPSELRASEIRTQLPQFLTFEAKFAGSRGSASPVPWSEHVDAWYASESARNRRVLVKYEDLRQDAPAEIIRVYAELFGAPFPTRLAESVADSHSIALRKDLRAHASIGRSFIRTGKTGGWREAFTREAGEVLNAQAGANMRRMGYVVDESWWHELDCR